MTEITVQGPALTALDPATRGILLQTIVDTMPHIPNAPVAAQTARRAAAFALLGTLAPTDPVQAMLAADAIAAHHASVTAYRWAARSDLPPALQLSYLAKGASLSRLASSKRRELLDRKSTRLNSSHS